MKKLLILTSAALLIGCTAESPEPDQNGNASSSTMMSDSVSSPATSVETQEVVYATIDGTEIQGYMARAEGDDPRPGLILIHEWWGLNEQMRDMAEQFAAQGYTALAVDLYEGESTTDRTRAGELSGAVREDIPRAMENLRQAVAFLKTQQAVEEDRIASVGWCFGGGWSYEMAQNNLGVKSTVMYYGQFDPEDDFENMRAHIIGHFGEEDMSIKVDDVDQFRVALDSEHEGTHEIYIYPNAGHGFANPENPNFNEEAAEQAWQRTMSFLRETL